jgi:hypothetical protein
VFITKLNIIVLTAMVPSDASTKRVSTAVNCAILQPAIVVVKHMQENNLSELTK